MNHPLLITAFVVLVYVSIAWAISALLNRADIVDPFWGPGFFVIAVSLAMFAQRLQTTSEDAAIDALSARPVLLFATGVWGLRLGLHLLLRWLGEQHEDRRYAAMRSAGTQHWWFRSLFTVFWLQGVIMWIVSLPVQFAMLSDTTRSGWLLAIGAIVFLIGLFFEAVGDWQLTQFRKSPDSTSKVLNTGLWRYTRHPNYFGDFAVWWGLFLMSVHFEAPIWTVISPLIMSCLLMKFSGVGMLEKDISGRRPGYAEYVRSTSTFLPWFPQIAGAGNQATDCET